MQKRKANTATQYERPVAPSGWNGDARRYVEQVNHVFDNVFKRYRKIRMEDLGRKEQEILEDAASKADIQRLTAMIEVVGAKIDNLDVLGALPVGTWLPYSGTTPPSGKWMFPQGQPLSAVLYPQAWSMFGDYLPDARGRVLVARDNQDAPFATLHQAGGEKAHALTVDELPPHKCSLNIPVPGEGGDVEDVPSFLVDRNPGYRQRVHLETDEVGGGLEHNNLQPYMVVGYIVKVLP